MSAPREFTVSTAESGWLLQLPRWNESGIISPRLTRRERATPLIHRILASECEDGLAAHPKGWESQGCSVASKRPRAGEGWRVRSSEGIGANCRGFGRVQLVIGWEGNFGRLLSCHSCMIVPTRMGSRVAPLQAKAVAGKVHFMVFLDLPVVSLMFSTRYGNV
jgi:hypothetical protein